MQTLDVVNEMLGTMGQAPLNTLDDPHRYRGACLSTLNKLNRSIQAKGWWFNREVLKLEPSATTSLIYTEEGVGRMIYVPGDTINVRYPSQNGMRPVRNIVQRGRRLYDLDGGSYFFTEAVTCEIVRLIDFQELPETAAQYIADSAVLQFQSKYDGDTAKGRELQGRLTGPTGSFAAINVEETRNRRVNFITSNERLMRLKLLTQRGRNFTRR